MVRDGSGQRRDSVLPRDNACLESELPRGRARDGADAGHGHSPEEPRQVLAGEERREVPDGGRAGKGDDVDPALAEGPAERTCVLHDRPRPIGRHLVDAGPRGLEQSHEQITGLGSSGEQHALARPDQRAQPRGEPFGDVLVGYHFGLEPQRVQSFGGDGADRGQPQPAKCVRTAPRLLEAAPRHLHTIDAGEDGPPVVGEAFERAVERLPRGGGLDGDGRHEENVRAGRFQQARERLGLGARACHDYDSAGQRLGRRHRRQARPPASDPPSSNARAPRSRRSSARRSPSASAWDPGPLTSPVSVVAPSTLATRPAMERVSPTRRA